MSEQFTMPRKLAHELLGALFNGPRLNPAGYEALKQDFAARMRAAPAPDVDAVLIKAASTAVLALSHCQREHGDDALYQAVHDELSAALRSTPARSPSLRPEPLLKAVNVIARQLIDEQSTAPDGADEEDFAAGKMAGTVQFAAEMIKHIQLASASTTTTTTERN